MLVHFLKTVVGGWFASDLTYFLRSNDTILDYITVRI